MKINQKKTKTAVFNVATSRDFYPRMTNSEGTLYENVEEFKLLGVEFQSHPKSGVRWEKYISKCIRNAHTNMWVLKRLSELGVPLRDILMTYESRVRVHLEMNAPLWHFSIPKKLSENIERVQKSAVFIILGKLASRDYICNLALLGL